MLTRQRPREVARARPVAFGVALTIAWWLVTALLANGLPWLTPPWFPDLRSTLVNLGALGVPLAVVAAFGWWRQAGLGPPRPGRHWWPLAPLLLAALGPAATGLAGTPAQYLSSAALFAALGLNEELLNRGVIQHATGRLGPARSVAWVAALFGLAHAGNALFFGRPLADTGAQIISATAFGLAYAAVRLRLETVWPLAFLHGLSNFCKTHSAVDVAWWWHLAVALLYVAYALWFLRRFERKNAPTGHNSVTSRPAPRAGWSGRNAEQ